MYNRFVFFRPGTPKFLLKILVRFLTFVGVFLFLTNANASTVMPMTLSELTESSDTIIVGRTKEINSYWKKNKILTDVRIELISSIKGDNLDNFIITVYGGTAIHPSLNTSVTMQVPGASKFAINEKIVVFSRASQSGLNQVVGMSQGKFVVETDEESGIETIPVGQKKLVKSDYVSTDEWLFFSLDVLLYSHDIVLSNVSPTLDEFILLIKERM